MSSICRSGCPIATGCLFRPSWQLATRSSCRRFFSHPLAQYIDLLFLANCSCIILDDATSGYYLHGRNQVGQTICSWRLGCLMRVSITTS
jgi:hypothetical protein